MKTRCVLFPFWSRIASLYDSHHKGLNSARSPWFGDSGSDCCCPMLLETTRGTFNHLNVQALSVCQASARNYSPTSNNFLRIGAHSIPYSETVSKGTALVVDDRLAPGNRWMLWGRSNGSWTWNGRTPGVAATLFSEDAMVVERNLGGLKGLRYGINCGEEGSPFQGNHDSDRLRCFRMNAGTFVSMAKPCAQRLVMPVD